MISINGLTKIYPNGFKALDNITLNVSKDEFVFFVGQSGAGKSTLLNMMFLAEKPTSGSISIENINLNELNEDQIPLLRRKIGVIFQDYKLLPKRTVYENIAFAL